MKKLLRALLFTLFIVMVSFPQSKPMMYFCERYDSKQGELGISSTLYSGYFTVMVKADQIISYNKNVTIQIDQRNSDGTYSFYKSIPFEIPKSDYIYFTDDRLFIDDIGIYRIWLLDVNGKAITHSTLEIIQ